MRVDCTKARTVIECYADGELDPVTSAKVEDHLEGCAVCQGSLERLHSLSVLIKEAAPSQEAPDRLARRIRARVDEGVATRPPTEAHVTSAWWNWWRPAALVAVTAVVTWIAAGEFRQGPTELLLTEEVISSHARATLTGHVADVVSSDRHTVKPWLSSRLDFSPPVTDLAAEGFPLVGGRLDYLGRRPVAVLVYKRRQHVIDLFVWPHNEAIPIPAALAISKRGYQVVHWTDRGMAFWAISDLNAAELKTFGDKFSAK